MALSLAGAVALALVCLLAYRVRARAPLVSFGIAWFLLLLVPSSSILPLQSAIAEHRVYLASLGLFLVVAVGFGRLAQAVRVRSFGMRAVLYAAGVLILADLAVLTLTRNAVWADPVALWREAATTAPRWDTYMSYGNALRDAGDCESALAAYNSAIRIAPERLLPVVSGWICLVMLGKTDQAREVARYINRVDPQLDRLCQEVHALAPHMVSLQSCVQQFRPLLGSGDG
jgi:tetratricopeptide (TPR) repeat protein